MKTSIDQEISQITDLDINTMRQATARTDLLLAAYEKLNPNMREAARGAFGMMLLKRLNAAGYIVTVPSTTIEVKPVASVTTATPSQATQLKAFL